MTISEEAPIIIAEDVHKWYGQFHVLRGVNLTVSRGEVVVLMGPSGSGKYSRTVKIHHIILPY